MPTLNEVRTRVNDWLSVRWPTLVDRQEQYFANHGRYFQGLWTHSAEVEDGADVAPDNLLLGPTDQAARWPDFITLPNLLPCALRIDVYEGPDGHGWRITLRVKVAGNVYQRQAEVGPQGQEIGGWHQVPEQTEEII